MKVELTDHLGYEPHQEPPGGAGAGRRLPRWAVRQTAVAGDLRDPSTALTQPEHGSSS